MRATYVLGLGLLGLLTGLACATGGNPERSAPTSASQLAATGAPSGAPSAFAASSASAASSATAAASSAPSSPAQAPAGAPDSAAQTSRRVVFLDAGGSIACAVLDDGRVACWGGGGIYPDIFGKRANGPASRPVFVTALRDATEVRIAESDALICALSRAGTVTCVHRDPHAALSGPLPGLSGVTQLAVGERHACARTAAGEVFCWGEGEHGALGDGNVAPSGFRAEPALVKGIRDAAGVTAGSSQSCAWKADGSVWCWGYRHGPGAADSGAPVRVAQLEGATRVVTGGNDSCAPLAKGGMRCWDAEFGSPIFDKPPLSALRSKLTECAGVKDAVDIGVDDTLACATTRQQTAYCWGNGKYGTLGDGKDHRSPDKMQPPREVQGLAGAVDVETEGLHSCARTANGDVYCWGMNSSGELGDGSTDGRAAPVRVRDLTGAVSLALGDSLSCALLKDGSVWCWGDNNNGQVGSGSEAREIPAPAKVMLPG
jgi:alpha-tubulin suppressor-like RCC1 family protein